MVRILSTMHDAHVRVDAGVERRAVELRRGGLKKPMDARHVACAEKGKAEVLLATDDNLLGKALKSQRTLKVKVENPLRWVMEVLK